jgi:Uma2 family endonuclease
MVQCGILTELDNVELLEGRVIAKMPHIPPHDSALYRVHALLLKHLASHLLIRVQSAVRLGDSVPEPDLSVVRGPVDRYDQEHPTAGDVLLIVEVSDATLVHDREEKGRAYARSSIPLYWIVNLGGRRIEVYSDPTGEDDAPAYRMRRDYHEGENLKLEIPGQDGVELQTADIFPTRMP